VSSTPRNPRPPDAPTGAYTAEDSGGTYHQTLVSETDALMQDFAAGHRAALALPTAHARARALSLLRDSYPHFDLLEDYLESYENGDYDAFEDLFDTLHDLGEETPFHPPLPYED